jgi:hypothetical protein
MRNFEILRFEIRQFAVRRVNFMAFAALVFVRENLCVKGRAGPTGSKDLREKGSSYIQQAKGMARGQAAAATPRAAPFALILSLFRCSL